MNKGSYTFNELASEFIRALNASDASETFTITTSDTTFTYELSWDTSNTILFLWDSSTGHPNRLFGAGNQDETIYQVKPYTFENVVDHSIHFVDLVIPEIPYIACKQNMLGKKIIDRIPLDESSGNLVHYSTYSDNIYFHPINLSKITIQLYEDSNGLFYDCQNNDNSFEFEITMLNL